jgi:amino acid permease
MRNIFGIPYTQHCGLLPYICDDLNVNIPLYHRLITFCRTLATLSNILTNLYYHLALNGSGSFFLSQYQFNFQVLVCLVMIFVILIICKHIVLVLDFGEIEFMLNRLCTE